MPEHLLILMADTIDVHGGSAIVANVGSLDTRVERMVWMDGTARRSGEETEEEVRIFLSAGPAERLGIALIRAAATPKPSKEML